MTALQTSGTAPRRRGKVAANNRSTLAADVALGTRMRLARLAKGLSQSKLGDALGVTFQQVQKYEKGTNRVAVSRLGQIARALDVSTAVLLGDQTTQAAADAIAPEIAFAATSAAARRLLAAAGALARAGDDGAILDLARLAERLAEAIRA